MFTFEEHLDSLTDHIEAVRRNCLKLANRLAEDDREDEARVLVANSFIHDASKFHGIEWDYLHKGKDIDVDKLSLAVRQHQQTNPHHPEYWGGIDRMPEIYVAEMVCDWIARAQEFGTCLRDWIKEEATERYNIKKNSKSKLWIGQFVDMLLEDTFVDR